MQNVTIEIKNKRAKTIGSPSLVCNNSDYKIKFIFDEEWADTPVKTARLVYSKDGQVKKLDLPFEGDTVEIPKLGGVRDVRVGVYAGDLKTTTSAWVPFLPSILCSGGVPDEPSEDVYNQIMELFNKKVIDPSTPIDQVFDPESENAQSGKALADLEKGTIKSVSDIKLWELDTGYYYISGTLDVSKTEKVTYNKPHLYIVHKLFENQVRYIHLCADSQVMTWAPIEVGYSSNNSVGHKEYMLMDTSRLVTEINKYCRDDQFPSAKSVYDFVSAYVNEQLGVIDNGRY